MGITYADLPNLVSFKFVFKLTQYDIRPLLSLYKDAEDDRFSYSLCLCTKGVDVAHTQ
jgi:hypothetical protein